MNYHDIISIQLAQKIPTKQVVGNPTNKLAVRLKQKIIACGKPDLRKKIDRLVG